VWDLEKLVEETELIEDFECGGMDGVAAEVAEEVGVFFKNCDSDALAREKVAEHDSGGTSSDDAAGGCERICGGGHLADELNK